MKKPLLVLLLLAVPGICFADSFPSVTTAKEFTERIMSKVAKGDIEGGLKMMKPYTIIPSAEFDAVVGQTNLQLPALTQRFGKSLGQEFIREDAVGESLVRITYINKFEKHAMRWQFYLYKGKTGWVINTFAFDDRLQELFPR